MGKMYKSITKIEKIDRNSYRNTWKQSSTDHSQKLVKQSEKRNIRKCTLETRARDSWNQSPWNVCVLKIYINVEKSAKQVVLGDGISQI